MRVLLAGGGTAGHVEPALNLAAELHARHPDCELVFLGTPTGLENRLVPAAGYRLLVVPAVPLPRRANAALLRAPRQIRHAIRQTAAIIEQEHIDVVVGFGSYVALPAYLAARRRAGIVVHEANAKAGLGNRVGARLTTFVAQAYPGSLPRAATIGIPLRRRIADLDRAAAKPAARAALGLDADRPCLLVFGGSQGARSLNAAVAAAVPPLVAHGFQVLHGYGAKNEDQVSALTAARQAHYRPLPYLDDMALAYAAADLAICRAGALTCAEVAAVGLPAIYVPLPIGNGEQRLNAAGVVAAGGGVMVTDRELGPDLVLSEVDKLLGDQARLEAMTRAAGRFGVRDASERLADMVESCAAALNDVSPLRGHTAQNQPRSES